MLEVAQAAGMSEAQISQFERGRSWPRRVDDVVEAYEHECGLEDGAIWRRVIG